MTPTTRCPANVIRSAAGTKENRTCTPVARILSAALKVPVNARRSQRSSLQSSVVTSDLVSDPLRLSHCPGCGYALEGLPPEGVCPECGGHYRPGVIVLHGFGKGVATGRAKEVVTAVVVYAAVVAFIVADSSRRGRFELTNMLYPGVLVAWTAWALWKRWRSDMPGLVQVWLGPEGARQVNNPTAGTIKHRRVTPWEQIKEVRIDSFNDETAKVQMTGPTTFWRGKQTMYAEVACDPQRAAAVLRQVEAWREEARRKTPAPA